MTRLTRAVLLTFGALAALVALALTAGGGTLVWAHATQRDSSGYYTTDTERFVTDTYALTSHVDLGDVPGEHDWTITHPVGTVRIRATAATERALFVGVAPTAAVDRWLAGVARERVRGANFGPFDVDSTVVAGDRAPTAPTTESFWAASATGSRTTTLRWPSEGGDWTIVVTNADGSAGIDASVDAAAKTGLLLPIGIGLLVGAVMFGAIATLLMFLALRGQAAATGAAVVESDEAGVEPAPLAYPVRLDGELDPDVSRWQWLVKWLLVIPHVVVLAFLWLAVTFLTVFAGFAILFTGRYPRSIFDFNVGVMRWTWRVGFYTVSAFGTDRYPPFSLRPDPAYPAGLDIPYPEHLSRGLVLVKWWLLAIPHYLVVAIFAGGWGLGGLGGWRMAGGGGLIALLALVAVVVLAVRGRYPRSIFDFVMGLNRWCYRVLAYVALLRDEYPPFRLDMGGHEPVAAT
jgi:hypothetical protein